MVRENNSVHIKTYTAGEDNGRLAALAKELGLQRQRQVRKQVRSPAPAPAPSSTENLFSGSFFNSPTRSSTDDSYRENKKNASHVQICTNFAGLPLTSEEAQAKLDRCPTFRKATDKFSLMRNNTSQSLVKTAIALDYGIRLRTCLEANTPHPAVASRPWR